MELWIRSQDKCKLLKTNYIEYDYSSIIDVNKIKNEYHKIITITSNDCFVLGTYKTKERVLEVLDEIQNKLLDNVIATDDYGWATLLENTCFYQMPKE